MPRYKYLARDNFGKKVKGFLFAENENSLAEKLSHSGYVLIYALEESIDRAKVTRLNLRGLLNLTVNLSILLKGGTRLLDSLKALAQDAKDKKFISLVMSLADYIEAGGTFKNAVSLFPETFPKLYISLVDSGERTGKLYLTLEDAADYLEWQLDLRSKSRELMAYPAIVFTMMLIVVSILSIVVIPKFEALFLDLGTQLPLITKIVVNTSNFTAHFWYILVGFGFLSVSGLRLALRNSKFLLYWDKFSLRIPILGPLIYDICLARFCRAMGISLGNGITIIEALELGKDAIGNKVLSDAAVEIRESAISGGQLYDAFVVSEVFPSFVNRMVQVGERSGSLADGFKKANEYYDKQVPAKIKAFFTFFEPALIVVMGVIVCAIALAVILPLLKLSEGIGGAGL